MENFINDKEVKERASSRINAQYLARLTDREVQVWELLMKAKTEKEIAELLSISVSTVRTHKNKISEKMNIKGKKRLSSFALIDN